MRAALSPSPVLLLAAVLTAGAQPPPPPPPPPSGGVTGGVVGGVQGGTIQTERPARDAVARPATGTSRISGRVVAADSGAPLRRAQVRLSGGSVGREPQSITTDADGNFSFSNLPAGSYVLSAQKTNFLTMSYGQKRPSVGPGKPVKVGDGQSIDKIDLAMLRAGVITGRVIDDVGEPLPNSMVQALRPRPDGPVNFSSSVQTDDLGQFRLHGLQPGEYIVSVSPRNMPVMGGDSLDRTGYAQTFFPGTSSIADAQKIQVQAGLETPNVVISLMLTPLARVSGIVMDPRGNKPPQGGSVQLRPVNNPASFGMGGTGIRPDGTFQLVGVAPGSYTLEVRSNMGMGGPDQQQLFATAPVAVNGEDVTGLVLMLSAGATARGRIVFEGGEPPAFRAGMNFVSAGPLSPGDLFGPTGPAKVFDDWTFEIKGLFGRKMLRGGAPAPGWILKSIANGNTDVTDTGVEFKGSGVIDGFEVKFVKATTSIEATITDAAGQPAPDAVALIFTTDRDKWTTQSRFIRLVYPNPEGRMTVSQLPPGDYYAVAIEIGEPGAERNPEVLDKLSRSADRFTLFDGEKKLLALRYSPQ